MMRFWIFLVFFTSIICSEPFQLNFDNDTYNDTIIQAYKFEKDDTTFNGGFLSLDFGEIKSTYILYPIGEITNFGTIQVIAFSTPASSMYRPMTYSLVTSINEEGKHFTRYKHRDSIGNNECLYSDLLLSDERVGEYINDAHFTNGLNSSEYISGYFQMIPYVSITEKGQGEDEDIYTPKSVEYLSFIEKDGQTLRVEVYPPKEMGRYSTPVSIRFSTDSAGNGLFKLGDTPVLEESIYVTGKRTLYVKNTSLILPPKVNDGSITLVNILGREVLSQCIINENTISLKGITPGIYTAIVYSPQGILKDKIFIK